MTFLIPEPPPAPHKSLTASCHLLNFLSIAEITHVHHVISASVRLLKCTVSDEHVACLLCGNIRALNSSPLTSEIQFQALATSSTHLDAWLGVDDAPQNEVPLGGGMRDPSIRESVVPAGILWPLTSTLPAMVACCCWGRSRRIRSDCGEPSGVA